MADFWKGIAVVVLAVILSAALGRTEKHIAVILSVFACCMVAETAIQYLSEVMGFLWKLSEADPGGGRFLEQLLKIAGVSILTEITCLISTDSGNASLGKVMQLLGNAMILVLALPVFEAFFTIIQEILRIA